MRRAVSTLSTDITVGKRSRIRRRTTTLGIFIPAVLGNFWYVSSDWQGQSEKLYERGGRMWN